MKPLWTIIEDQHIAEEIGKVRMADEIWFKEIKPIVLEDLQTVHQQDWKQWVIPTIEIWARSSIINYADRNIKWKPYHISYLLQNFEGDWGKLAENFAHDPTICQAIKSEIERRLNNV